MGLINEIKELRGTRATILKEAGDLLVKAGVEERDFTPEEQKEFDEKHAYGDKLLAKIEAYEKQHDAEMREAGKEIREEEEKKEAFDKGESEKADEEPLSKRAYNKFLRHGMPGLDAEERQYMQSRYKPHEDRALTVTTTGGGYVIPDEPMRGILDCIKALGGILSVADIWETNTGASLPIPTGDDTSNIARILSINTEANTTADPTFGQETLGSYMYVVDPIRVPIQLIDDASINIASYLEEKISKRLGLGIASYATTGTGSSQPEGVTTGGTSGKTSASATEVTLDELIDLEFSLDEPHRKVAKWVFNDVTLKALKKMRDGEGRPIFQAGWTTKTPDSILGYEYAVNSYNADIGADAKPIFFGNWKYLIVRMVKDIRILRLEERFADYLQVGFMGFMRSDSVVADPGENCIMYMTNAS